MRLLGLRLQGVGRASKDWRYNIQLTTKRALDFDNSPWKADWEFGKIDDPDVGANCTGSQYSEEPICQGFCLC